MHMNVYMDKVGDSYEYTYTKLSHIWKII